MDKLSSAYDELKMIDEQEIAKDILYTKQHQSDVQDKSGKRFA